VHHMQSFMLAIRSAIQTGTLTALEGCLPQRDALPSPVATAPSTAMTQVAMSGGNSPWQKPVAECVMETADL
jgi:hypothetical protein